MQLNLTGRSDLKHKNVNDKTTVHSLFLGCIFKEIQIPSGSHVALSEPVAIKSLVF